MRISGESHPPEHLLPLDIVRLTRGKKTYSDLRGLLGFRDSQTLIVQFGEGIDDGTIRNEGVMHDAEDDLDGQVRESVMGDGQAGAPATAGGNGRAVWLRDIVGGNA